MLVSQELRLPALHLSSKPPGHRLGKPSLAGPYAVAALPRPGDPRPRATSLPDGGQACPGGSRQVAGPRGGGPVSPPQGERSGARPGGAAPRIPPAPRQPGAVLRASSPPPPQP